MRETEPILETNISYSVVEFSKSLESSFIEADPKADNRYAPRILANDDSTGTNVLSVLQKELRECVSFDFSVAFITDSGIQTLIPILIELKERGIPGRILTSTYLNFNDPEALRKLSRYSNIEIRVYQGDLHAKGYFFDKGGLSTVIVGSSNLTQTALTCNKEWNVLFHTYANGGLLSEAKRQFESLWLDDATVDLTEEWIREYEQNRQVNRVSHVGSFRSSNESRPSAGREVGLTNSVHTPHGTPETPAAECPSRSTITPNKMQRHALEALDVLHKKAEPRALLVSATGTGKTYLSALDVDAVNPRRVLFVAHRKRILSASLESFKRVLQNKYSYELYGGGHLRSSATCVFAMVGMLSRHLTDFEPDAFDYIIIDEAHRTGASSYQAILDHFTPKFCLGMTATPSRTDGYDVYSLFNHVIAYRITLQDALDNEMLAPFHYFGIADLDIDDEAVDDFGLFSRLTSEERVRHVVQKIEEYTVDKAGRRGLIFCNRNEEAATLSAMFNERGYHTIAISGASSDAERDAAIAKLENGELQYIFSVDILNEGVDIPSLNQIIMLRRTESAIVFVQQLGRGLRIHDGKEYTLVLDFIGNYQKNYLVPIALSGDRSYNKDSIRKYVMEGERVIPGCSSVHFDEISRARIFESIDNSGITFKFLKEKYTALKHKLGRVPFMVDFQEYGEIDPLLFVERKKSYYRFLASVEPAYANAFSEQEHLVLEFASRYFGNGMRPHELVALREAIEEACASRDDVERALVGYGVEELDDATYESAKNVLTGSFVNAPGDKKSYASVSLVEFDGENVRRSNDLADMVRHDEFRRAINDLIDFGLARYLEKYSPSDYGLKLYEKYTRKDACRLLNWEKDNSSTVYGYRVSYGTCPIFVTYEKSDEITSSTQYADEFESPRIFSWMTRSRLTLDSPEVQKIINAEHDGLDVRLFIKKSDSEGADFYYFGRVRPVEWRQTTQMDNHGNCCRRSTPSRNWNISR